MKEEDKPVRDERRVEEISGEEMLEYEGEEAIMERWDIFQEWYPFLRRLAKPGAYTPEQLASQAAPAAIVKLIGLMVSGKSERVQMTAAKELAYMGGMKPVEKSQSVNVNVMPKAEAASMLAEVLKEYNVKVIDSSGETRFLGAGVGHQGDEGDGCSEVIECGVGEKEGGGSEEDR